MELEAAVSKVSGRFSWLNQPSLQRARVEFQVEGRGPCRRRRQVVENDKGAFSMSSPDLRRAEVIPRDLSLRELNYRLRRSSDVVKYSSLNLP